MITVGTLIKYPSHRELSARGQAAAEWFKQLARGLATCRIYRRGAPTALLVRDRVHRVLAENLDRHGEWDFRVTPAEVYLGSEPVVHPTVAKPGEEVIPGKEEQMPFLFYRDGIRGLKLLPGISKTETESLFDALLLTSRGPLTQDDIVTLLWQANPAHIRLDSVPLEQVIYLIMTQSGISPLPEEPHAAGPADSESVMTSPRGSSVPEASPHGARGSGRGASGGASSGATRNTSSSSPNVHATEDPHPGVRGPRFGQPQEGTQLRGDLGALLRGARGLHRDEGEDWIVPVEIPDEAPIYQRKVGEMEVALTWFETEWKDEIQQDWTAQVPDLIREVIALDDSVETRRAFVVALTGWMANAIQQLSWSEWESVLTLLREVDPDGSLASETLTKAISALDLSSLAKQLNVISRKEQMRFLDLALRVGMPALPIGCALMTSKSRLGTRAMASSLLCTLCEGNEAALEPFLRTVAEDVLQNLLFVLGQIGGPESVRLIQTVIGHPSPRVRREAVAALAAAPGEVSAPLLIDRLEESDTQVLTAIVGVLSRNRESRVARALQEKIEAPGFRNRSEGNQRLLLSALAEVVDEDSVPALRAMLHRGGWRARPNPERFAAARALLKTGVPEALRVLEEGACSRRKAVREACRLVLSSGNAS